jgi:hypothetical protein
MSAAGHKATKSAQPNDFRFPIPKPTQPTKRSFCAAAIRLKDRFLIGKQTLGLVSANGCLWPKVALRRHRNCDRSCGSHEGPESTQNGHST